jgi:hypothetical protein
MKKRRKDKPTDLIRQKTLAKLLGENGGKKPIGKLMIEAGYAKSYAHNPKKLKRTKNWQELMETYFPDTLLAERHRDLLNKKEYIAIGKKGEREAVCTGEIDGNAVARGLDMGYKLKGKYTPEEHKFSGEIKHIEKVFPPAGVKDGH